MSEGVSRQYRIRRIVESTTLPLLFLIIAVMPSVETLKWMAFVAVCVIAARRLILTLVSKGR